LLLVGSRIFQKVSHARLQSAVEIVQRVPHRSGHCRSVCRSGRQVHLRLLPVLQHLLLAKLYFLLALRSRRVPFISKRHNSYSFPALFCRKILLKTLSLASFIQFGNLRSPPNFQANTCNSSSAKSQLA
jgi:hypothetical protein